MQEDQSRFARICGRNRRTSAARIGMSESENRRSIVPSTFISSDDSLRSSMNGWSPEAAIFSSAFCKDYRIKLARNDLAEAVGAHPLRHPKG